MFKLVVLSLFAVAAAEPGVFFTSPYTTYSSVVAPASTTITKTASSVVHPSPVVFSAPFAYSHFIKKRSPGILAYNYAPTAYVSSLPYAATPLLSTPVLHSSIVPAAPIAYTAAHLIKKRSAPLLIAPTTYAAASPLISTYASAPVFSTPLVHSSPLISTPFTYSTHFIKKRSAPLFVAPTTYAAASPFIASTYAAAPVISTPLVHSSPLISTPLTYSTHFIKKRSAPLFVAPTTYTAASPFIASTYAAAPVISTPLVHSSPLISTPLTYATHFIKK